MNTQAMKLGTKLALAFLAMVLLTVAVGGFALSRLAAVNAATEDIAGNWLPSIKKLGDLRAAANQMRRTEADHVMSVDTAEMDSIEQKLAEQASKFAEYQTSYEKLISGAEERALYEEFRKLREAYVAQQVRLVKLSRGGDKTAEETKALFRGDSRSTFNAMAAQIGKMVDFNAAGSDAASAQAGANYRTAITWTLVMLGAATVMAAVLAFFIVRGVKAQLGGEPADAAAMARRVADGDLSADIHVAAGDTTSLMAALRRMQDSLSTIVAGVPSDSVADA